MGYHRRPHSQKVLGSGPGPGPFCVEPACSPPPPLPVWVSSRYSGFLPQSKDICRSGNLGDINRAFLHEGRLCSVNLPCVNKRLIKPPHPTVHYQTHVFPIWVTGGWRLSREALGEKREYGLDKPPLHGWTHTFISMGNLESPVNPRLWEETRIPRGNACTLHTERPGQNMSLTAIQWHHNSARYSVLLWGIPALQFPDVHTCAASDSGQEHRLSDNTQNARKHKSFSFVK